MTATLTPARKDTRPRPPVPPKGERTCGWITRPWDLPDGRRMGLFFIREGGRADCYKCVLCDADDMEQRWAVSKEQADGTFAESYHVLLSAPGCSGRCGCGCRSFYYRNECRHVDALKVLLSQLLN
jgi:hypothetical protein